VEVLNDAGPVIALRNSRDIRIDNLGFANGADALVKAQGRGTAGISIRNTNIKAARKDFDLAEDVSRDAFRVE
jgi:DNA sulfur modification protein DndE